MSAGIDNIQFLATSAHRVGVLEALRDGPTDRQELCEATGASSPTVGRVLADFSERQWLVRDGPTYGLTSLGEYVADRFLALRDVMEIEEKLRDVWHWLPVEMPGFSVDLFADAVVSYPGPGYPYEPVERLSQLIASTSSLRGFDNIVYKSSNLETACGAVLEGMTFEYVFTPEALEGTFAWNPDRIMEVTACENAAIFVHDNLPDGDRCGLGIVDDRAGICCHDTETGALVAVIDTDAPKAREWAISVFEEVRVEATPLDAAAFDSTAPS
ncbi:helix-turn-helix transcriptional regulator [Haladaptatus caseinilyticus]|uniref:helix-turn-helix transcriptional regulator n=1 Tax=Haladaptatus caseinilyticus TaxID=2993314 RepID=UPI00224AD313|nr:transcriptional regulator [Haladaptatus caseinilyticus]